MAPASPEALTRALSRASRGGVFFLYGEEEYLKEEAVQALIDAHVDPAMRDFNLDQLRGGALEPETLASICQTPPMMAEWRVVVVREAQAIANAAKLRAVVDELVARRIPGLALVFTGQIPDRSKAKFYQDLIRNTTSVEFPSLPAADLPGWLVARAEERGTSLEPSAARALAAAIGSQLGVLMQELAKLTEYVGESRRITTADVREVVGAIPKQNRWDWIDLVADRKLGPAREGLGILLDAGESGVGLVIGLGTHFLRLAIAATGGEQSLGNELPPHQRWLASRIARQARRWRPDELESALDDLLRADRLLKSTSLGDRQILEEFLLRRGTPMEVTHA